MLLAVTNAVVGLHREHWARRDPRADDHAGQLCRLLPRGHLHQGRPSQTAGVTFDERPASLRGRTVVLRPLRPADLEAIVRIRSEPGVQRWWGPPDERQLQRQAEGTDDEPAFAIEVDGRVVGLIQYSEEDEPDFRHTSIDLFLSERARGRGLGPDAIRTLARYLVDERGHHRLTIDPAADNTAAVHAYEKVGFRPVGVMREYWRSPDGTWRDGLLMELVARELEPTEP